MWLSIKTCEAIYKAFNKHAKAFGLDPISSSFGERYENRLESILGSIRFKSHLLNKDVVEVATEYFVSIVKNQAFLDGNKRLAIVYTVTYLDLHGYQLKISVENLKGLALMLSKDLTTNTNKTTELLIPIFKSVVKKRS